MRYYKNIGIQAPQILLPSDDVDYSKWAVVACDQYTSQPDYWEEVEDIVGESPSTFKLILPEAYLGTTIELTHQKAINTYMREYLNGNLLNPVDGFIYTERTVGGKIRRGLIAALDLEQYSYKHGSKSLIRATEGTIIERLPPRIKIRKDAVLEIPHILVLIDDPEKTVIEPVSGYKNRITPLYDFNLMQHGGHLEGYLVSDIRIEQQITSALEELVKPESFSQKYNLPSGEAPFLYAVGDGNHSLATAKSVWEEIKTQAGEDHPARNALVELVNIHDEGITFEPIHRLLINLHADLKAEIQDFFSGNVVIEEQSGFLQMKNSIASQESGSQKFGFFNQKGFWFISIQNPLHSLTVGSIQTFLDDFLAQKGMDRVDYVHGDDAILKLGSQENNAGIYLPAMQKSQLFNAVIKDGELPRKTFSMGEACEKRFYLECRKIQA
jgi:uncharacterized protein (DUF1015 family)